MAIKNLIEILEKYKTEIARQAALEVQTRKLSSYVGLSMEQLVERFSLPVGLFITYLQTGQPQSWQAYINEGARGWRERNWPDEEFAQTVNIFVEVVTAFIEKELPGEGETELAERKRLERRVESVRTLTLSTLLSAHLRGQGQAAKPQN